jgi:cell division protein FtsI (penicillin-binding protein 3)
VTLSIDARIQYVAYAALKDQVTKTEAINGSAVVLNPYTGEVLAAVSYPSFNPNDMAHRIGSAVRDAAITDIFEPGSTMKVFTISEALKSGQYTPTTPIDTSPGWILIQGHRIYDDSDNGLIDVTRVLKFSSNVGATKIALTLPWQNLYDLFTSVGFGHTPAGGFPGAENGLMIPFKKLSTLEYCTMAFGYAIAVSTLQLGHAYTVIANGGTQYPVTFLKQTQPLAGTPILPGWVTADLRMMLITVVQPGGTATRANIPNYTVVGKTGTTNKVGPHGLEANAHNAMFAGLIPQNHPMFVIVVHMNNPIKGFDVRFGGFSAAPVFAKIAQSVMAMYGVPANPVGSPAPFIPN